MKTNKQILAEFKIKSEKELEIAFPKGLRYERFSTKFEEDMKTFAEALSGTVVLCGIYMLITENGLKSSATFTKILNC